MLVRNVVCLAAIFSSARSLKPHKSGEHYYHRCIAIQIAFTTLGRAVGESAPYLSFAKIIAANSAQRNARLVKSISTGAS